MRVLLFTQYYRPEITAGAMRTEAFVDGLVARGHEVGVICEVPEPPAGSHRSGLPRAGRVPQRGERG